MSMPTLDTTDGPDRYDRAKSLNDAVAVYIDQALEGCTEPALTGYFWSDVLFEKKRYLNVLQTSQETGQLRAATGIEIGILGALLQFTNAAELKATKKPMDLTVLENIYWRKVEDARVAFIKSLQPKRGYK